MDLLLPRQRWPEVEEARQQLISVHLVLEPDESAMTKIAPPNGISTTCPDALELAQRWINKCQCSHTLCTAVPDRKGWNPTRLVDVRDLDSGIVRVVTTTFAEDEFVYFTLSHRWGDAQPTRLTKDTEPEFSRGVAVSKLPRTFRDAILVTNALGREYLWIDSLCIFQDEDDRSDWLRESAQMDQVYMHGDCNLSAIAAIDVSHGLSRGRRPEQLFSKTRLLTLDQEQPGPRPVLVATDEVWKAEAHSASLNHRGWVVQERILSKRILYFGEQQLLWECCELDASEVFPQGVVPSMHEDMIQVGFKAKTAMHRHAIGGKRDRDALYQLWNDVVEMYSGCSLTVSSDKLVAVSGIANRLKILLNDDLIAGLWRGCIADGLFWRLDMYKRQGDRRPRPRTWRAPTWSWASVDSAISPGTLPGHRGVVWTDCLLEPLRFSSEDQRLPSEQDSKMFLKGRLRRISRLMFAELRQVSDPDGFSIDGHSSFRWDAIDVGLQHENSRDLFFMPGRKCYFAETDHSWYMESLLLLCENAYAGVFSRAGLHVSYVEDI